MIEILKAAVVGIIEGITEWLPVSSTGHIILIDEFLKMNVTRDFKEVFDIVIQFGAILAVILLFWKKIWPFDLKDKENHFIKWDIMNMWFKIVVACLPAIIVMLPFDDLIEEKFHKFGPVSMMLIIYGILFIVVENWNADKEPKITSVKDITYTTALLVGLFQVLSIIPGTSRSGATILGALIIGLSRTVAAEFSFFLAIPAMAGYSLVKLLKHGFAFTGMELGILASGMIVSFLVSLFAIKFLMGYIRKHNFKVFGYYRIILGIILLTYMFAFK